MNGWLPCVCPTCVRACKTAPGWMHPDDLEPMAKHFDVSVEDLFRTRLVVNWFEGNGPGRDVFVLSPAKANDTPGKESTVDPRGRCAMLTVDDRCVAHGAHPQGCRAYLHDTTDHRAEIIEAWRPKHDRIEELLGYEPEGGRLGIFDLIGRP